MKKTLFIVLSFFLLLDLVHATDASSFEQLSALSGCWQGKYSNRTYEEHWMEPAGDMMLGVSRTVRDGKVAEYEFLQIQKRDDGTFYIAHPSEQTKAEFKLKTFDSKQAIFEDPTHDFPQRIIYQFNSADQVSAWIEGTSKGQLKKIEFPMVRVKCPGGK